MSDTFSKVEVITGVARRRRFSTELKLALVAETMQPGLSVSYVARRHGLSPSLLFRWRRLMSEGGKEAVRTDDAVVAASEVRRLEERVPRAGEPARPQNDGSRDPKGGSRLGTGKKNDLAVTLASTGRSGEDHRGDAGSGALGDRSIAVTAKGRSAARRSSPATRADRCITA